MRDGVGLMKTRAFTIALENGMEREGSGSTAVDGRIFGRVGGGWSGLTFYGVVWVEEMV